MKTCGKCQIEKPLSDFRKGKRNTCKICHNETYRRWSERNRERVKGYMRQYYAANKAKMNESNRRWRYTHLERAREISRRACKKYLAVNGEKVAEKRQARRRQELKIIHFETDWGACEYFERLALQWSRSEVITVEDVLTELSESERQYVERFLQDETPIPADVLACIREKFFDTNT